MTVIKSKNLNTEKNYFFVFCDNGFKNYIENINKKIKYKLNENIIGKKTVETYIFNQELKQKKHVSIVDLKKYENIEHIKKFLNSNNLLLNEISERILNLINLMEEDDDCEINIKSLIGLIFFLINYRYKIFPNITARDEGIFCVTWRKSEGNLCTISFNEDFSINVVRFEPSLKEVTVTTSQYLPIEHIISNVDRFNMNVLVND